MHIIRLIQNRFPNQARPAILTLAALSAAALAIGLGLLLLTAGG